jgi:hypothetical protein
MHSGEGAVRTTTKIVIGAAVVFGSAAGLGTHALAAHAALHTRAVSSTSQQSLVGTHLRDSDHDGMPNRWEIRMGLNPHRANAKGNPDHDGIVNLREYRLGTDPEDADTDDDGIDDGDEASDCTPSTDPTNEDTDGDGIGDGQEDSDGDGIDNEDDNSQGNCDDQGEDSSTSPAAHVVIRFA